jgi:DNA-directed RNA polymerase subunit D|tara:strand:+ start:433 stop:1287 length:855 start_codon:yes stop_codon:yes gene_type:complete
MKIKVRKMEEESAVIEFNDSNYNFLNSLRRSLVSMVPCLAISDVDFHMGSLGSYTGEDEEEMEYESMSSMFNEIIAHRLGMIPIPTEEAVINAFRGAIDDEEKQPEIMYSLHKQGPCTVYSGDLEPVDGDKQLEIKNATIPIVKLTETQAILVYAKAKIGTADVHSKWQTVVAPRFYEARTMTVTEGKDSAKILELVGKSKFKKSGKKYKIEDPLEVEKAMKKIEKLWIEGDESDCVELSINEGQYIFEYETTGALTAKLALEQALKELKEHFEEFSSKLEKLG